MSFAKAISTLVAPDYALMRRVQRWRPPRWLQWWMIVSTRGGDGWLWAICGVAVLASDDGSRYAALFAASLAITAGIVVFLCVKNVVGRARPHLIEPHCWANLLPPDRFSFPSGHSITAFAAAVSLGLFYPAVLPALLFCASSVALSRIVLGLHFLSDVLVGSGLGAALGYWAFRLLV